MVSGNTVIGAHDSASWTAALSTVTGLGGGEIWCNGTIPITASYSIASGIRVHALQGCTFSVSSGQTLTFPANGLDASPYVQVFTGSGNVAGLSTVEVPWFGALGNGT